MMAKQQLKAHVSDRSRGVKNNPGFFSTETMADQGIVSGFNSLVIISNASMAHPFTCIALGSLK